MEHITRNWKKKKKRSTGGEITVMIALREAWGRLVLCNTASKVSGPVPKQTVLWSRCLSRSRDGGVGGLLAPFCSLADGTKISKCQVSRLPSAASDLRRGFCHLVSRCPLREGGLSRRGAGGEGRMGRLGRPGWGVGGWDVSLSIAPQSGELQAQCSEHERQRA